MTQAYPTEMTPALADVLGMPNFRLHPIWMALRETGIEIRKRYEDEAAAALHFLIPIALRHGEGWQPAAADELLRLRDKLPARAERFSADARLADGSIAVTVYSSVDPGPARMFTPIATVTLDEAHATELLGTLMIALDALRGAAGEPA